MIMNVNVPTPTDETYSGLEGAFDHFNRELFDNALPRCLITLQRQNTAMGYHWSRKFYDPERNEYIDEIALNPVYFASYPLLELLQTLVHEMTHLWQAHFGKPSRSGYHNKEWGAKMQEVGLMPSSTGQPGGKMTGQKVADYPIEDGPFVHSAARLVATGFTVHWLDVAGFRKSMQSEDALGASVDVSGDSELGEQAATATNKSKIKYQHLCPTDDGTDRINVWGKPNLSIACGNCGVMFEAVTPDVVQGE